MSVIEGVGDEVTIVVTITSAIFVVLATYLYRTLRLGDLLNLNIYQLWQQFVVTAQAPVANSTNTTNIRSRVAENSVPEPDSSTADELNRTQSDIPTTSESEVSSSSTDVTAEIISEESQSETLVENSNSGILNDSDSTSATSLTHNSHETTEHSEPTPANLSNGNAESVPSDEIQVRLKYLNDTEKLVSTHLADTIGAFKRVHFASDLNENKVVRLIFNGQLLRDNMTLQSYRIENRTVLHVHVSQAQPQPNYATTGMQSDLDISSYMWPLFSIILALCWIIYIRYPEFFSITSVILLVAFSASFLVVYVHSQVQYP